MADSLHDTTLYCPACMAREALADIERYRDTRDGWVYEALGSVGAMLERIRQRGKRLARRETLATSPVA